MSTTIENRVLEMRFDNKQFESGVATSMSTLDKLKQKLNLSGASKGLEDIGRSTKNVDMSGLGSAVETVSAKFSALQVMGVTALANITNSAVNAGKRMISALTIDPIKTGFNEYETKMNSIQTIMSNTASKGTTMADVTRVIDELNTYADKTIYNFAEMTRNIGTFTAAGVGLEESASAIQGIANLAAASGSSSQQASTAMYQLSQALAAGTVKLMDWNSVVNAGMGGEKFQEALKATAREHGVAVDEIIKKNGSFRDSLQDGWLSADILNETLNKFTVDGAKKYAQSMMESGKWTQEQADALIKEAQAMEDAATKVKTFTQLWDTLKEAAQSGWGKTWEIIFGDFEEAKDFFTYLSDTFGGLINASSDARNKVLQEWKDLGGRNDLIDSLKNVFEGVGSIVKPITEAFREIFPPVTAKQLKTFTEGLKELTSNLKISDKTAQKLKSTFKGVFSVIDIIAEAFKAVGKGAFDLIGHFTGLGGGILGATSSFGDFLSNLRDSVVEGNLFGKAVDKIVGFLSKCITKVKEFGSSLKESMESSRTIEGFIGFFEGLWDVIKKVGSAIGEAFGDIGRVIADAFGKGDIFEVINSGLFASILLAIRNFIKGLSDPFEKISFLDRVKDILDGVKGSLESWQKNLQAGTLLKIAGALGILAAALYVISGIDSDKLGQSLGSIAVLFGELIGAMALMGKLNDTSLKPLQSTVGSLGNIARTISMIGLGAAVLILAGAMKTIGSLDWDGVKKGLVGISVLVGVLVAAARLMNTESKSITKFAGQMVILSAAVAALSGVAKILGSMSWEELAKGGIGIITLVTVLVQAAKKMDSEDKAITKFAGQMAIMSIAIGALSGVAKILGSMSWSELAKGGAGILGITIILVKSAKAMNSSGEAITKFAGQMVLMSIAIGALSVVAKSLASMSWGELAKGGAGILGFIIMFTQAAKALNSNYDSITKFAGQMLLMSVSLAVLVPVLKSLGSMSIGSIAKSLITLGAAFAVIGVAGALLSPLTPVILGLAGAFALFGVATAGIGIGMMAIAAGFTALATAGAAGAAAFVAALTVIVTGVLNLIPEIAQIIGRGIVEIAKVIGDYAPQLAESFLKLILGVLESLEMYAPQIVDSLLGFFIGVLNSLSDHVPELIQVAMKFIGAIFQGIVDALGSIDTGNLLKGVLAVGIMTALMYALSGVVALIPSAMAGMLGVGAVIAEMAVVLAAVGALAQIPGLEWLIGEGGNLLQKIGTAIGQFVGGIAGGIMEGVTSSLPQVASDLSMFMQNLQPFIAGAQTIDPSMMEGVQALAKAILLLTAADIVSGIASFLTGGSSLSDFAKQLVPLGEGMKKFGDSVAGVDTASITASASAAKALVEVANAIPADGGLWGLLAGDKDLGSFGEKLVPFGKGMKSYATAVAGIDTASITASASAAKAIVQVADAIPAEGGLWQLIAGEKDLGSFGQRLVPFGLGMKLYSSAVAGLNSESIVASAAAAKAIVEVANAIPPEGGFWQLLSGEKDLASFGMKLVPFGLGMKRYAATVTGIDMTSITASAAAAKALVSVANAIPPDGGFWQLLSGEKDLASFGTKLVPFGFGMKAYAATVAGIDSTSIIASTTAAKALVSVANSIPAEGGFWSLIDGEKNLASFGTKLIPFGQSMKKYAEAVAGVDSSSIIMSAVAAQALIGVAKAIPPEGGFWSLIDGDKNLGSFGMKLIPFGKGMKSYAEAVAGIDTASIAASVPAAMALISVANAIPAEGGFWSLVDGEKDLGSFGMKLVPFGIGMKKYAEAVAGIDTASIIMSTMAAQGIVSVANSIPAEGGFWSLVDGEKDLGSFGMKLVPFGKGMKSYSEAVSGLDAAPIIASAAAAKAIVQVANAIPKEGGISSWFSGDQDLGSFGQKLVPFGKGMKSYSSAVAGLDVASITASVPAAKAMVNVANAIPSDLGATIAGIDVSGLGSKLTSFGLAMRNYSASVVGVDASAISSSVSAAKSLVSLINSTAGINAGGVSSFVNAINTLGKAQVSNFVNAFSSATPQMASAGTNLMRSLINGIRSMQGSLTSTATSMINAMANILRGRSSVFQTIGTMLMSRFVAGIRSQNGNVISAATSSIGMAASSIRGYYGSFYSAGTYLGSGLVIGIQSMRSAAYNAGYALGQAAAQGEKDGQKSRSPSKLTIQAGKWLGEGLVIGMEKMGRTVYKAGYGLGDGATNSISEAISRVGQLLDSDIDVQPTISPVIDLTNVKSGVSAINGMLDTSQSIGVMANVRSINAMMNRRNQNGEMTEVVSAINKLRKDLSNVGNTYNNNIGDITYGGDSDISTAVEALVRAARMERRV